ncbi:hypothetical protein HMSSN036_96160 [Paenibacillus macerans]|nr:hypothetical protein HMSSN036_96160 [Paenibacillus macerans]
MESFSRVLWGVVPHLAGGAEAADFWEVCLKGIINGTTPTHQEYWGMLPIMTNVLSKWPYSVWPCA